MRHEKPIFGPKERMPRDAERLRQALYLAALREAEADEADPQPLPPPSAKTLALIRRASRRPRPALPPRLAGAIRIAAAALALLFIGIGTAMALSAQLRITVLRLLWRVTPQYTELRLAPDEAAAFDVPADWPGEYYPSFIPEGYRFYAVSGGEQIGIATYTNVSDSEKILRFIESDQNTVSKVDTEGYSIETIDLRGSEAMLARKSGHSKIIWQQAGKMLLLSVTEDRQTALKIAESVTRIK